jgi:uncharacterized membrane protein
MDNLSKGFIALSAVGIVDAIYHAYGEITAYSAPLTSCNLTHSISCETVFTSGYTKFLGVSLWVYGVVWFPLMLVLGLWFTRGHGSIRGEILVPLLMIGNVFTVYLWYLEIGVIHAICPVCVSLYVLNYVMTILAALELLKD